MYPTHHNCWHRSVTDLHHMMTSLLHPVLVAVAMVQGVLHPTPPTHPTPPLPHLLRTVPRGTVRTRPHAIRLDPPERERLTGLCAQFVDDCPGLLLAHTDVETSSPPTGRETGLKSEEDRHSDGGAGAQNRSGVVLDPVEQC